MAYVGAEVSGMRELSAWHPTMIRHFYSSDLMQPAGKAER